MYDSKFIELLKQKIVLSDVVRKRVNLVERGRYKTACCPFHKEKSPSFHVNDEKGFYHCFGCGAHGDAVTFLMQQDGLSFREAVEQLAEEYGVELPKFDKKSVERQKEISDKMSLLYEINEQTCTFFQKCIFSSGGKVGLNYILKRGLNTENVKKFRIGYAPVGYGNLMEYLKKLNFTEGQMEEAGVVAKNEKGYYDKFRNRVMFPVFDKKGRVIAFSGRVLNKDDMPKYMNSPETPIYHKSDILFNYFFARKSMYDSKQAILVEGNLDAISLSINGVENVVAPMGTAITQKQIEELWAITEEIICCLDGDLAGQKASKRLAQLILPMLVATKNMKFVFLPNGQDPDDFIKTRGKSGFLDYLKDKKNCLSLSEFLWNSELSELGMYNLKNYVTPEEKSKLEIKLKELTKQIANPVVSRNFEDFYRKQLFLITKFDGSKKVASYRDVTNINYKKIPAVVNSTEHWNERIIRTEESMFNLLISQPRLIDMIFQTYNVDILGMDFHSKKANELVAILMKIYELNLLDNKDFLYSILEKNNFSDYFIGSSKYDTIEDEKKLKYLYGLVLERNIAVLEIEFRKIPIEGDGVERRKGLYEELEILQNKKNDLEEK
ncbi:MAG: DNA primase [Rickettsiales bacterium]|nr:DNA primase [Rickettsiales bacterium]